jgi:hypothetical protein
MTGIFGQATPVRDFLLGPRMSVGPPLGAFVPILGARGGLSNPTPGLARYHAVDLRVSTASPPPDRPIERTLGFQPLPKISGDAAGKPLGIERIYPRSCDAVPLRPTVNERAARFEAIGSPTPTNPGVWSTGGIRRY